MDSFGAGSAASCAIRPVGRGVPRGTEPTRRAGQLPTLMYLSFLTCPYCSMSVPSWVRPPTGEPDARDLPVRFGGRGAETNLRSLPLLPSGQCDGNLAGTIEQLPRVRPTLRSVSPRSRETPLHGSGSMRYRFGACDAPISWSIPVIPGQGDAALAGLLPGAPVPSSGG